VVKATKKISKIKPKELSIRDDKIGTRGNNPKGNTTFLTKLGCAMTELEACVNPLVNAIQGNKPANSHNPKVKLLSGTPCKLSLTLSTIANT
jgi:hypothetical protein